MNALPIHSLAVLVLFTACGDGPSATPDPAASPPQQPSSPGGAMDAAPTDEEARLFAGATNAFATDLWGRLRSRKGNLVVSPASIELALAMTWAGARGRTAEQMAAVMHFGDDPEAFHRAAGRTLSTWNDPGREAFRLAVANRLFGEEGHAWRDSFLELTGEVYGAPLEPTGFADAPGQARQRINGWVAERTNDRIEDLLPPGAIDADTRMVLANAIHFLADWEQPFSPDDTDEQTFHAPDGDVRVETMHRQASFGYAEPEGVQVLRMPYAGGDLAMMVVLPRAEDGLGAVEEGLTVERLAGWAGGLERRTVIVALPRFRAEPEEPLDLAGTLRAMGMADAFDPGEADFSAMAHRDADGGRPLYIGGVFHQAFVAVDEEGTEAAAATGVVMKRDAAPVTPPDVPRFVADHPFLFFIRDLRSGTILFLGRVLDPTG